ncbi:MAG TPA: serine/threonine-protein kinase, partial [Polyangiaceae bacterium]|nr:serine/threonine-protein kinase [Polyangiaceae bacterium]
MAMQGGHELERSDNGLLKGHIVAERFVIERLVAQGGMGVVYAARDRQSGEPVALKVMQTLGSAGLSLDRFEAEAQLLARLRHPAIVRYVAHGVSAGAPYLAMEWLGGETLEGRLRRGPLPLGDALAVATRVAEALAFAHGLGIIHRDVKPSNVIVDGAGQGLTTRLLDFGIARGGEARPFVTRTGAVIGTPGYMAPEQARGDANIDARVDVFALGCVLFECLTGFAAFRGATVFAVLGKLLMEEPPSLTQAAKGAPPALAELVSRMLAKDPAERPRDGGALLRELERLPREADAPGDLPAAFARLTHREQRFVSVVVAGEVGSRDGASELGAAATLST